MRLVLLAVSGAAALGIGVLGEAFTVQCLIGGLFILSGILLAELPERKSRKGFPLRRQAAERSS